MPEVYLLEGKRVPEEQFAVSPLGSATMFGFGVLDRLRGYQGHDGKMRILGLQQHLHRTLETARVLFPDLADLRQKWQEWIVGAVRASELATVYVHLGFGQYVSTGTMLQSASGGLQTLLMVKQEEPLYGDALRLSSEQEIPRPDGLLARHKVQGLYSELLLLKQRARARLSAHDPKSVEALLFSRQAFRVDGGSTLMLADDPYVAEYGCANAFTLDARGELHLPAEMVRYFPGLTVQIVEALFRAYFPEKRVWHDLRRSHLRFNGGAAGTASGVVPVVELDGTRCETTEQFEALAGLYRRLGQGELNCSALQEKWAPVLY